MFLLLQYSDLYDLTVKHISRRSSSFYFQILPILPALTLFHVALYLIFPWKFQWTASTLLWIRRTSVLSFPGAWPRSPKGSRRFSHCSRLSRLFIRIQHLLVSSFRQGDNINIFLKNTKLFRFISHPYIITGRINSYGITELLDFSIKYGQEKPKKKKSS